MQLAKKVLLWGVFAAVLVGVLSGCGKKQQVITNNANSIEITEEKPKELAKEEVEAEEEHGGPAYPDESQIKDDLMAQNANYFNIANVNTRLDIDTIEILRRKSDDQCDEVYVSALLRNEHYTVETGYFLFYSLYDVGGWCLDYYSTGDVFVTGTKVPITEEEFRAKLLEEFSYCEILDRTQEMDSMGNWRDVFSFSTSLWEPCLTLKCTGTATYTYDDDCWKEQFDFDEPNIDWGRLVDSWNFSRKNIYASIGDGGESKCDIDVTINISGAKQLSEKELELVYSGNVYVYQHATETVAMDALIPEQTAVVKIYTTNFSSYDVLKPVFVVGSEIEIPWPWSYGYNIQEADVSLCKTGLCFERDVLNDRQTFQPFYFAKQGPSDEELQAATERLKAINGLA